MVLVEGLALVVHQLIAVPGFRDQHHHGVGHGIAGGDQQLQGVVETGGVGLALGNQREQLGQIVAQQLGLQPVLARRHPVDVAAHGVDLAVVADHPVGVGEAPRREGVGGKALMDQRQRRHHPLVLKIEIIGLDLTPGALARNLDLGQQHALVDHGARRHRRDVEVADAVDLGRRRLQRLVADQLANHEQLALEGVAVADIGATADKHLPDHRLGRLDALAQAGIVNRNVAPAEDDLPFLGDILLDPFLADLSALGRLGQEDHAHAVITGGRQFDAGFGSFGAQKGVGHLEQDAGAVALQRVGADRAAMIQILQDFQALGDDRMTLHTLDVGDEAHATGVMFSLGIVETRTHRQYHPINTPFRPPRPSPRRHSITMPNPDQGRPLTVCHPCLAGSRAPGMPSQPQPTVAGTLMPVRMAHLH